jgi:hypothetical protein
LNDGSFENSAKDDYVFNAPDVGKIAKIELFYTPTLKDNCKENYFHNFTKLKLIKL